MFNPKVSIIIPVYNGANYLREAIDSAISQTYKNIEIIVVNDGSSDNGETEEIALSYGDKIRYFKKENGGSSSALNLGLKMMTGDYFSWLSHDDLYEPNRIEKVVEKIDEELKERQIVICGCKLIDKNGDEIFYPKRAIKGKFDCEQMFELLKKGKMINGCAITIPKCIIDKIGFFDENLVYVNDIDYWYRLIILGGEFIFIDAKLVKTRIHDGQVTVKKANLFKKESKILAKKVFDNLLKNVGKNLDLIYTYMKKAAFDDNMCEVKDAVGELKKYKRFNYCFYMILYCYNFYGKFIRFGKKIYKKVFFKR